MNARENRPSRVFVIDDDEATRLAISEALEARGMTVLMAGDGRDALDQLRGGARPSVILLDLMMPSLNGWELRKALLHEPELASIPVIIMTAAGAHWGVPDGVTAVFRKPFDLPELIAEIERALV